MLYVCIKGELKGRVQWLSVVGPCTIWWRAQSLLPVTLILPIREYSLNYHQAFVDKREPYISWVNHFLHSNYLQLCLSLCFYSTFTSAGSLQRLQGASSENVTITAHWALLYKTYLLLRTDSSAFLQSLHELPSPFRSAPGPNAQWLIPSLDMQQYGHIPGMQCVWNKGSVIVIEIQIFCSYFPHCHFVSFN